MFQKATGPEANATAPPRPERLRAASGLHSGTARLPAKTFQAQRLGEALSARESSGSLLTQSAPPMLARLPMKRERTTRAVAD